MLRRQARKEASASSLASCKEAHRRVSSNAPQCPCSTAAAASELTEMQPCSRRRRPCGRGAPRRAHRSASAAH
eukprot:13975355-Alexandrium_andersonii.AAC.1